jgi:hypothetical protein
VVTVRDLFVLFAWIGLAQAAGAQSFQIWSTLGAGAGFGARGEILLEVEDAPGGSDVRFVYVGLRDVACGGITVTAWEKHLSRSPQALARPLNVCRLTADLQLVMKRHPYNPLGAGMESDSTVLVAKCGTRRTIAGIPSPLGFNDLAEGSADEIYMDRVWDLDVSVLKAAWGEHPPDIGAIDPAAERAGEKFVARVRRNRDGDPFRVPRKHSAGDSLLESFLSQYHGPLGKPAYHWKFETEPDVKFLQRDEPRLAWSTLPSDLGVKSYNQTLILSVDPQSGKVTKSVWKAGDNSSWMMNRALEFGSMQWVLDPATIPASGQVQVDVQFQAACGPAR